ncbi:hypothetical protein IJI18_00125 [Candidatus Saccharibacteria bacterium]|nr:hypothetical protein [Candidatus Saccharibacteria bacterium]
MLKRFSFLLSLVAAVSSLRVPAFAANETLGWDDIPTLFWEDGMKDYPDDPEPEQPAIPEDPEIPDAPKEPETPGVPGQDPGEGTPVQPNSPEDGPGEYFELPDEVAGGEGLLPDTEESQFETLEQEADFTLSAMVRKDYQQPTLYVKQGYDAISAFVTSDTSDTTYDGKIYFIISGNGQWLMYNYKPETAALYFEQTEDYKGMRVPSKKADSRQDNTNTPAIDESKVPLIKHTAFNGMYCNWRSFDEIPFTKGPDGKLLYATYEVEENDGGGNPGQNPGNGGGQQNPGGSEDGSETAPGPDSFTNSKWYRYTVSLNSGNTYRFFVTRQVSYNGKCHVLDATKAGKNRSNDIKIWIYSRSSDKDEWQLIDKSCYKVKFRNNKNCNYYANGNTRPYFWPIFKFKNKALKGDAKALRKKGFGFDIAPVNLGLGGSLSYKGIDKKGGLKKAVFTTSGNVVIKMNPYKEKNLSGDYRIVSEGGKKVLVGINNFAGKLVIESAAPNNGGGNYFY